tara:strand:+ start:967 stop:1767 length:801 start_codon:yes stop_codon:yes gene_type:complete
MKNILVKIFVIIGFFQMLIINYVANSLPINGITTGDLSDKLKNLFTPQGSTFGIWGVIYSLLLIFIIRLQIGPIDKKTQKLSKLFIINSLFNSSWIFAWHYELLVFSLILMIGLLINLIKINILLKNISDWSNKLILQMPFTIYYSWISIATIANVTSVLVGYEWTGFGLSEEFWTQLILIIGIILALSQLIYFKQIVYIFVFLWAYLGIYLKHVSLEGFNNQYPNIINVLIVGLIILILSVLYHISNFSNKDPNKINNSKFIISK